MTQSATLFQRSVSLKSCCLSLSLCLSHSLNSLTRSSSSIFSLDSSLRSSDSIPHCCALLARFLTALRSSSSSSLSCRANYFAPSSCSTLQEPLSPGPHFTSFHHLCFLQLSFFQRAFGTLLDPTFGVILALLDCCITGPE